MFAKPASSSTGPSTQEPSRQQQQQQQPRTKIDPRPGRRPRQTPTLVIPTSMSTPIPTEVRVSPDGSRKFVIMERWVYRDEEVL